MIDPSKVLPLTILIVCACSASPILAEQHTVGMAGWEFNPVELTIRVGDTVVWHNDDDTAHNVAFEIEFADAPTLDKPRKVRMEEKWAFTFDEAGVYKYTCKIHRKYDMNGVIVVKDQ
jgi:plastocyanin